MPEPTPIRRDQSYLPQNIDAEQALIGAVLVNNQALFRVDDFLAPEHFYDPVHTAIYEVMRDLIRAGKVATPVTMKNRFDGHPGVGDLSVPQYLVRLVSAATTVVNAREYGMAVLEVAQRRDLLASIEEASAQIRSGCDAAPLAEGILGTCDAILGQNARQRPSLSHAGDIAEQVADAIEAAKGGKRPGLPTGLKDLDRLTGGIPEETLTIIAGRPSMGKSTIGTVLARNVAAAGHGVLFVSLEMSAQQLGLRIAADICFERQRVPYFDVMASKAPPMAIAEFQEAAKTIADLPLVIEQRGGLTAGQVASRVRQAREGFRARMGVDLKLVVVDYLQLLAAPGKKDRYETVTEASNELLALARNEGVSVVALAQLSRAVETREDKRPIMSDLRESGALEQDAATILFAYREAYYLKLKLKEDDDEAAARYEAVVNDLDIIAGKNRNGPVGSVKLFCDLDCAAIRDRADRASDGRW